MAKWQQSIDFGRQRSPQPIATVWMLHAASRVYTFALFKPEPWLPSFPLKVRSILEGSVG
ncbi:MAG TPA: hypothetical protein V6C84_29500 [Coleofasciculaceae cyanobacterium]